MRQPLSLIIQQIPWKDINENIHTVKDYEHLLQELWPMNWGRRVVCVLVTCFLGFRLPVDSLWTLYEHYLQKDRQYGDTFKCPRETHSVQSFTLSSGYVSTSTGEKNSSTVTYRSGVRGRVCSL